MERLSKGDMISLGGAVALFISLFSPWYGVDTGDIPGGVPDFAKDLVGNFSVSGFEAFRFIDIVLVLLAIGSGALIILCNMGKIDRSLKRLVESVGSFAALAVLFRLFIHPADGLGVKWGIFLALIGAVAIALGQSLTRMGKI